MSNGVLTTVYQYIMKYLGKQCGKPGLVSHVLSWFRTLGTNIPGLVMTNVAIENGPVIVDLHIENGDFP